jgi:K+-sensing histidine kinase KdpD
MELKSGILIVDDDVALASNLQDVLEVEGYTTAVAYDGQTALSLCREKAFDLALVDIMLPDMSGTKLIAKLYELSSATVYVVITGYASMDSAIEAVKQRSIVAYETKPINMERLLSLIRQVVERKQLEEKARQLEALRELDQLRRQLLATVSHELRTPLASIKGYSTMLLDYDARLEHDEKREYLESIDKATIRLTELVDNLLDMSRLEAGLLKLEKAPISISKLLRETVTEAQVWAPDHRIVLEVTKKLPRVSIDAKRIRQVLDNLIDNASKYSGQGTEILVSTKQVGQELMLSVADQGIGIPAEELPRVFDPMYRIRQRLTPEAGGAGLGLTICKGLVEAHGGRIWMESEEGKGSTCFFTLPLDTKEDHHGEEV